MTFRRSWTLIVSMCLVGSVAGWIVIGARLRNDLQVEGPGNRAYAEYVGIRDMSPWAGVVLGVLAGLLVALAVLCFIAVCAWARNLAPETEPVVK